MNQQTHFGFGRQLDRRTVLRGAGVSMALPWLSAMQPALARPGNQGDSGQPPRRLVAMSLGLGLHAPNWIPEGEGKGYKPSLYLEPLEDLRRQLTVVSGSSHPGVTGGHRAEASILTASPIGSSGKARNSISIDQYLAKYLGNATRFPSLVLSSHRSNSPSYTENGSMIPAESSPSTVFERLFVDESEKARKQQAARIQQGQSIMDLVADDAKSLQREVGAADRDRLDAYFTSVRELEQRMAENEKWAHLPKPKVDEPMPKDVADRNDLVARQRTMCDVIRLALKTDSTRFITFHIGASGGVVPVDGVDQGYHSLSHHGRDEDKLSQLALVEAALIAQWGEFLRDLEATSDDDGTLLDNTSVLLTSNLGNASNHDNRNMPVLLAGGGFSHGKHLAFDQKNNYPLPKLFVSLLQQCGLEVDEFAGTSGTMVGLS